MKSNKFWLILIGAILALSLAASLVIFLGGDKAAAALIYQDGVCIRRIDLAGADAPWSFTVEWEGGYNVVEVDRGRIRVAEADCPDQTCVRQGWRSAGTVPIACLPHKLVIQLESGGDNPVDGVAG